MNVKSIFLPSIRYTVPLFLWRERMKVYDRIRQEIRERLIASPITYLQLAAELGVSLTLIQTVASQLRAEGLLSRRRGRKKAA